MVKSRDLKTRGFLSGVEAPVSRKDSNERAEEIVESEKTRQRDVGHLPASNTGFTGV
jgi:hypothetical protein